VLAATLVVGAPAFFAQAGCGSAREMPAEVITKTLFMGS